MKLLLLNPPTEGDSRKYLLCVTQSRRVLPCPFIRMTNIHFRTRESQEEPSRLLKVFTAALQPALQSSCHLHHKWHPSILYSGCKYLWSACSKFLNCHITWGCTGRAPLPLVRSTPELGQNHQLAPSSVLVRPKKGQEREQKGQSCGYAAARWRGPLMHVVASEQTQLPVGKPPLLTAELESAKPGRANATWHLALFAQLSPRAVQTSLSTKIKASLEGNAHCRTCHHELGQSRFVSSHSRGRWNGFCGLLCG